MRPDPNPIQLLLQQAMGLDTFSLDGTAASVNDPWTDRPHLCKTPPS